MKSLMISPIQTSVFQKGDDVAEFIIKHVDRSQIHERSIIVVTSKIVSLAEEQLVPHNSIDKKSLIQKEADHYLGEIGHGMSLTIKHGLLVAAAGIDESNSKDGDFILYPRDPYDSAEKILRHLKEAWGLQELGIILTDSRTGPLRLGVVGVALSFAGFHPLRNMIGQKDLFDRPLKMTKINIADSLAATAVLMMGEAAERCPVALIQNPPVVFTDNSVKSELSVSPDEDIYLPLYSHLMSPKDQNS